MKLIWSCCNNPLQLINKISKDTIMIPRQTGQFGSLVYINMAAEYYEDIIEVYNNKDQNGFASLTIVCKPNYDKKQIQKFADEHLPLGVTYAIQTENI